MLSLVRIFRGLPRTDSVDEQFEDQRTGASLAGGALTPGSSRSAGGWIDVQPVRGHRRADELAELEDRGRTRGVAGVLQEIAPLERPLIDELAAAKEAVERARA